MLEMRTGFCYMSIPKGLPELPPKIGIEIFTNPIVEYTIALLFMVARDRNKSNKIGTSYTQ